MRIRDDAERLLADLLRAGALPVLENGRLTMATPPGVLTPERRDALVGCLPELRVLIASRWRSREECIARRPCRRMSRCARPVAGRPCLTPSTCCVCGEGLRDGYRYLCHICADLHGKKSSREPIDSVPSVWRIVCSRPLRHPAAIVAPMFALSWTGAADWRLADDRRRVASTVARGCVVSRSLWCCRNPDCSEPHGAVLGRITDGGGLILDSTVTRFRCFLDTRRAMVTCPVCGASREFRGGAIFSRCQ